MRPTIFAFVTLSIGIGIGLAITSGEFSRESAFPGKAPVSTTPTSATARAPKALVVGGERYDFGKMERYGKGEHSFVIRNVGNAPLKITLGHITCKCTVGSLGKGQLEPGEQTSIKLEWEAKTMEAYFEQSAEVLINEPDRSSLHLQIAGRVIDVVRPDRMQIFMPDLSANETTETRVNLFAYRGEKLEVVKHEWTKPETAEKFDASYRTLSVEEFSAYPDVVAGVEVTIKVRPGLPLGEFTQDLKLTTNFFPELAPIEIPIMGNVVSDISIAGPRVVADRFIVGLGTVPRSKGAKSTVYLIVKGPYREETKLQIESVTPSGEFTATLGEPVRDNPKVIRYPLTIEIPPGSTPISRLDDGAWGAIHLSANHPQVKAVKINVRYVVKD